MTEKPRYSIIVDDELMKKIEDFRFNGSYQCRSAATVVLIRLGFVRLEEKRVTRKQGG